MQFVLVDRRELDRTQLNWEQMHACLVVAKDNTHAREVAASKAGQEGKDPWADPERSSTQTLGEAPEQEARVLLDSVAS